LVMSISGSVWQAVSAIDAVDRRTTQAIRVNRFAPTVPAKFI
jgi:hypothetical protein